MAAIDEQVAGDHYKNMAIQPIQFITANNLGFCEGNIIKYLCRWPAKGGVEDLKKARHYLDLLIESQPVKARELEDILADRYKHPISSVLDKPGTVVLTNGDMRCM